MDRRFFFRKAERLHGKKAIDRLFTEENRSIFIFPLRLSWVSDTDPDQGVVRVLVTASRKRFRRAHERNRVKRVLREVYRKNAHLIKEPLISRGEAVLLSLTYVGEKEIRSEEVERIFLSIVHRFREQIN